MSSALEIQSSPSLPTDAASELPSQVQSEANLLKGAAANAGSNNSVVTAGTSKPSTFDDVLSRLQKLTIPSLATSNSFPALRSQHQQQLQQKRQQSLDPRMPVLINYPNGTSSRSGNDNANVTSSHSSTHVESALDGPFSINYTGPTKNQEGDVPTIIDSFTPKPLASDLSPTSSSSSDLESGASSRSNPRLSFESFLATRSRVVRLYDLPSRADAFLSSVFYGSKPSASGATVPVPVSMWTLREGYPQREKLEGIWAVFRSHEEACAALSLSGPAMSVATALETDLEPFHKLSRFVLRPSPPAEPLYPTSTPTVTSTAPSYPPSYGAGHSQLLHARSDLPANMNVVSDAGSGTFAGRSEYTLSSNPPNPRTSFRLGDWICSQPNCAAHNFGRNLACRGCGCPRSNNTSANASNQQLNAMSSRISPPPRFASMHSQPQNLYSTPPAASPIDLHFAQLQQQQQSQAHQLPQQQSQQGSQQSLPYIPPQLLSQALNPAALAQLAAAAAAAHSTGKMAHPLLTPSGRAFAVGGRVQNISSDPLSPCIMYWPDNEPFPEQGQIRPGGLVGVPQPPILNTGNRGPISHQPGDWICTKCNYLNWRRRKVCQTCLPYAEGNGDSVSAAVQAERIALLTSVLSQAQLQLQQAAAAQQAAQSQQGGNASLNSPPANGNHSTSGSLTPSINTPNVNHPGNNNSAVSPALSSSAAASLSPTSSGNRNNTVPLHHSPIPPGIRSHSLTPPQARRSFLDVSPPQSRGAVHKSHSHIDLNTHYTSSAPSTINIHGLSNQSIHASTGGQHHVHMNVNNTTANTATTAMPIYQTSAHLQRQPSPLYSTGPSPEERMHAPVPLLPSFLQDIVQVPALSPASSGSDDLPPFEDLEEGSSPPSSVSTVSTSLGSAGSTGRSGFGGSNFGAIGSGFPPSQQGVQMLAQGLQNMSLSPTSATGGGAASLGVGAGGGAAVAKARTSPSPPSLGLGSGLGLGIGTGFGSGSIWRLDGEESKTLTAPYSPPGQRELGSGGVTPTVGSLGTPPAIVGGPGPVGSNRKQASHEKLRVPVIQT
ncbi:hypothetical protein AX16_007685 [Volvariella volvacea WC 439]|nr:hypothetical protein AX16_007685 [Volvariella volvacea WC 439]